MQLKLDRVKLKRILTLMRIGLGDSKINILLDHFLFEIKNKMLTIKSTNAQIATIWTDNIENEEDFSFTLPGLILLGLIGSLDKEEITLDFNPSTLEIKLISDNYEWETVSGRVSDYPKIEIPENLKEIKLPSNFSTLLKNVAFSISDDLKMMDLNSLCMDINKNSYAGLRLVATDRIRLSCVSAKIETEDSLQFIIPKSSVLELIKLEPSTLLYNENSYKIYFKPEIDFGGNLIFQTNLTNAKYPDIYAYLKDSFDNVKTITVDKNNFIDSLKRIKLISDKIKRVGSISINNNKMNLSTLNNLNKGKESLNIQSEINATFDCNIDFILDYLSTESASIVNFKVIENKCLIFDKENYRYVLSTR